MLCTNCHDQIKPVVAIDLDGTLGEYHEHFLLFAELYLGRKPYWGADHVRVWEGYDGIGPFRDWFCNALKTDLTTFRTIKLAYRQGAQKRTMPIYQGGRRLMQKINEMECDVWITTTRPYLSLDGVDRDTRYWLERHQIAYDHLLYDEEKYSVLSDRVGPERVVAVLDDEGEQYDKAEAAFGWAPPILRGTRYNAAVNRKNKSFNMLEAESLIRDRVTEWRNING